MEAQKFYDLTKNFLDECMEIMKSKGMAYSGTNDKFGNFKRVAKNLCMSPEQVWFVYFSKHFDALSAYIRGEYSDSEPIKGRIMDMVNYLLLLNGLIVEEDGKDKTVDCPSKNEWFDPDDPCGAIAIDWRDLDRTGTGGDPTLGGKIKVTTNAPDEPDEEKPEEYKEPKTLKELYKKDG